MDQIPDRHRVQSHTEGEEHMGEPGRERYTTRHAAEVIEAYAPKDRKPGRLTREHHEVLVHDAEGLKYREIAAIVGCPVGTIRSRLHRAKAVLESLVAADKARNALAPAGIDDSEEVTYR